MIMAECAVEPNAQLTERPRDVSCHWTFR